MFSSSVESHIDFGRSSSLRRRLRHEAPDVLFYRIARGVSACDAIDCPIEAARTVGVLEDASGRSDGGLQSDSPWAIVAEDLQPRQPPKRESLIDPCGLRGHHHFRTTAKGVLRQFGGVIPVPAGTDTTGLSDLC